MSSGGATQDGLIYLLNLVRAGEPVVDSYYLALIKDQEPGFSTDSAELDEPTEEEYSRAIIYNDSASWELSDNVLLNSLEVSFPPALSDWGQINYWAITDQPQEPGGRVLFIGQFVEPLFVEEGDQVFISPGSVGIDMGGNQWLMVAE